MVILPVIYILAALFIQNGYGLKCLTCQAHSLVGPNGCQTPTEFTCPVPNDRCFTLRSMVEINSPGGAMKMTSQMRNCSMGAIMCTEAYKQQICQKINQTASGGIKSCNYSCCEGDLCNNGTNPPGSGLTPSKPAAYLSASNVSLSCYECGPEGMGPNGTGTPLMSCSTPKQRTCGEYSPGFSFDRCMTVKVTAKNPQTGALLEQEARNCSVSTMCTGNSLCNSMNDTGELVKCNVQCCEGNLCNSVSQPTTGPSSIGPSSQSTISGPKGGQTPLAVSGILAIMSIVLALLFK